MKRASVSMAGLAAIGVFAVALGACSSSGAQQGGTGGDAPGTGGASGSGGATGSGGRPPGTGGAGAAGTGGDPSSSRPALVVSGPSGYWQTGQSWTEVTSNADVTVNDGAAAQSWEGFGGAFNENGWAALSKLSDDDRGRAMNLLFGDDGARFVLGRIPIGASDYALSRYSEDETAGDTSLSHFSIDRDLQGLIPYVKAAQQVRPGIRFWASPWTPPTWLKSGMASGNVPSPFDGGSMKDDDTNLKAYAQYFIKFIQAYQQQGIPLAFVAPQNEPNYAQNYPTCLWSTALYTKFLGSYLGKAFDDAGIGTQIMLGTMSKADSDADPAIVKSVLADATAMKYVKVIGMQWGMQTHVGDVKSSGIPVWQTEHVAGNCPFNGTANCKGVSKTSAPNDQAYAVESWNLIRDWIKTGITAYSAWNMVTDSSGLGIDTTRAWPQDALLTVDTSAGKLNVTPAYYVFRHFSQFADPGAQVVATTGGDAIAFKNPDGSLIAVMYNSGSARKQTVAIGGKKLQFDMPATGWATVNYTP